MNLRALAWRRRAKKAWEILSISLLYHRHCTLSHRHHLKVRMLCRNGTPPLTVFVWFPSLCAGEGVREEIMWERKVWKERRGGECDKQGSKSGNEKDRIKMSADRKRVGWECKGVKLYDVKEENGETVVILEDIKWECVEKGAQG